MRYFPKSMRKKIKKVAQEFSKIAAKNLFPKIKKIYQWLLAVVAFIGITSILTILINYYSFTKHSPDIEMTMWGERYGDPIPIPWGKQYIMLLLTNHSPSPINITHLSINYRPRAGLRLIPDKKNDLIALSTSEADAPLALQFGREEGLSPGQSLIFGFWYEAKKSRDPFSITAKVQAIYVNDGNSFILNQFPPTVRTIRGSYALRPYGGPDPATRRRFGDTGFAVSQARINNFSIIGATRPQLIFASNGAKQFKLNCFQMDGIPIRINKIRVANMCSDSEN